MSNARNTVSKNKPQIFACTHRNRIKVKTPNKLYTSDRAHKNFIFYFVLMRNKKMILQIEEYFWVATVSYTEVWSRLLATSSERVNVIPISGRGKRW